MFDFGMSELLVIGIVALIVIGPKDLPELFRSLGRFTAKMRGMAREFSRAMEQAADESGVKDVARDLKSATSAKSMGLEAVKDAASKFEKWDPLKNAAKPTVVASTVVAPAVVAPAAATANPTLSAAPAPTGAAVTAPNLQPDPQAVPPASAKGPTTPVKGPATQALADARAARQAIAADAAERLKKQPAEGLARIDPAASKSASKPRAPRKPKPDSSPKADA
jgi:sec-independent protein translocase protein TatB